MKRPEDTTGGQRCLLIKPRTGADDDARCRATPVDFAFESDVTLTLESILPVRSRNRTRRSCNVHARTHNVINKNAEHRLHKTNDTSIVTL